ncbi:MAG TPA: homoserine dehydrogenase, partial [Burkholderiales bacterium]
MRPINAGLLGIGTVGGGTWEVLKRNADEIRRRAGRAIRIARVADKDLKKARRLVEGKAILHGNAWEVVRAPDIDIVIELIGGTGIAKDLVLEAIAQGKHVVTANKALLAKHGNRIFAAAQKKNVMVAFEASVGGGIPIIKALREGLAANRIEWIAGIINGTSNFILSEMRDKGLPFDAVLAEAQRMGYAETDPTFDIEGIDAAHKLTILSALAFGIPMQFARAYTEGISRLTQADIGYAEELGYRIKLLGITRRAKKGIELRVHPTLVPARRLIANVEGVMNGILVKGDAVGATMYYGAGAGSLPTASAVVADLLDVTRLITADPEHRVPHLAFQPDQLSDVPILPISEVETSYYLRMRVLDKPGVLARITRILADSRISIDAMVQKEPGEGEQRV